MALRTSLLLVWLILGQSWAGAADDSPELDGRLDSWNERAAGIAAAVGRQTPQPANRTLHDHPPADAGAAAGMADFESGVRYYNLGLALIREGQDDQGATALDRIGSVVSGDPVMQALADRANLALAFHFLARHQADSAIPVLGRIRGEGRYSNLAILTLGRAWLLPAGSRQMQAELGDERSQGPPPESFAGRWQQGWDSNLYQRYRIRPFVRAAIPADESACLERALAAWSALIDRDSDDPAVVEGLLAIAGALDRLGAHADAARFRERALAALQTTQQQLQQARRMAEATPWIEALLAADEAAEPGGGWQLRALPGAALSAHLFDTLAGNRFQTGLHDLHVYAALRRTFGDLDQHLAASAATDAPQLRAQLADWLPQLEADRQRHRDRLQAMALDTLEQQAEFTRQRLADAHLSIARQYDHQAGR